MKKLLLVVAATGLLFAQQAAPSKTTFYAMTFDRARCDELSQSMGQPPSLCIPSVNVFIITEQRSIEAYKITLTFSDTSGRIGTKTQLFQAAPFGPRAQSATTLAYFEIDDIASLRSALVVPLISAGGIEH
jgi:hypothetical protein